MSRMSKKALDEFDRWSKEVKRGAASLAILSVLEDESNYGYEIVNALKRKGADFLAFEEGTVYPLLKRLEQRGLLKAEWNYDDPAKPRKYYATTSEGKEALYLMKEKWSELGQEMQHILEGDAL